MAVSLWRHHYMTDMADFPTIMHCSVSDYTRKRYNVHGLKEAVTFFIDDQRSPTGRDRPNSTFI